MPAYQRPSICWILHVYTSGADAEAAAGAGEVTVGPFSWALRRRTSRTVEVTASTRATAPATSAMRSERPREGLGPALVAKVADTTGTPGCAVSSGEGEGAGVGVGARPPFQVSAATSCSA